MVIKYREDPDLEFLKNCEQEDLKTLAEILIYDKDGKRRWTQGLAKDSRYRTCFNDYQSAWSVIASELQQFGGDSLLNMARLGRGVTYREILMDVAKKMRVNFNKKSTTEKIEMNLIMKVVEDALEKMSEEDKREIVKEMKLDVEQITTQVIIATLQTVIRMGGFRSYQLALIIANSISKVMLGRGLAVATNAGLARALSIFAGPIGIAINVILTIPLFTGPAYRATIPATIQVAYMRQKMLHGTEGESS